MSSGKIDFKKLHNALQKWMTLSFSNEKCNELSESSQLLAAETVRMKTITAILILVVIQTSASMHLSADKVAAIETLLQESLFKSGQSPALAVAIVTKDAVLYEGAKGFKDLGLEVNPHKTNSTEKIKSIADMNTRFAIASVTKGFTATLAVKLLSEKFPELGESVMDTPIGKLVPYYNFTLSDRHRTETVTFRDLLAHRTCLKPDLIGQLTDAFDGFEDYVVRQRFSSEKCGFRSEFVYNNGLYSLVGDLLAHLGNSSYLQLMQDLFLQMGMLNSSFIKAEDNLDDLSNRANPYREKNGEILPFNSDLLKIVVPGAPAGGIVSSARDMGRYMQFHLNQGIVGGNKIINRDAMKWLVKPVIFVDHASYKMKSSDISDFDFAYGLGFAVGVFDGYQKFSHAGSLPSYESYLSLYPDLDLGVFTVTSGPSNLPFAVGQSQFHAKIVDIIKGFSRPPNATLTFLLSKKSEKVNETKMKEEKVKTNLLKVSKLGVNLDALVGHYGSLVSGDLDVTLKNRSVVDNSSEITEGETLWLSYGRWGKGWLVFESIDENSSEISCKIQLVSDIQQILESSQLPEIMITFQLKKNSVVLFFKGQTEQGSTFRKGFDSKDFIEGNKTAIHREA